MAIAILFDIPGATRSQYDAVIRKLQDAGEWATQDGWRIVDVWDSQEHFERFGQTLMPILEETGFPSFEPELWPVHNVIVG
jgi:hypothetical protein